MSDVGVPVAGFEGVAGGFGLVGGGPADLAGVSGGPFLIALTTGSDGETVGVVAVVDDDSVFGVAADVVVGALGDAVAVEAGGLSTLGEPVGTAAELAGLFTLPTTTQVFTTETGATGAIHITTTNRRTPQTTPNTPNTAAGADSAAGAVGVGPGVGLDKLVNVALQVSVELGRTRVTLSDVLAYDVGSIIELDRAAGAPVDIRVNDTLLAQGEVVLIDDEYAVRITAIIEQNHP